MKKQKTSISGIDTLFILKALLIGVLGSVLLILSYMVLELSWLGSIVYNEGLTDIYLLQLALLAFLVQAFTGALAVMVLSPKIKRYTYAIAAGMVSGILAGIGFTFVFSLFVETINLSQAGMLAWQGIHDSIFNNMTVIILNSFYDLPYLAAMVLLSVMLAGVGGSVFYALAFYAREKKSRAPGVEGKTSKKIIAGMAAILLALAIIPPAAAYYGTQSGTLEKQGYQEPITAQRLGNDTIALTNNGGKSLNALDPASSFIVYIGDSAGGSDVTSQQAAAGEGLNVTVDPASGFSVLQGSTLTIKGKSIADLSYYRNVSTGANVTHIYVIGNTTDGRQLVYLDTYV